MYTWEKENLNLDTMDGQVVITRWHEQYGPFTFNELIEWIKDEYWHDEVFVYKIKKTESFLAIKEIASDCNSSYFIIRMFEDYVAHKVALKQDAIDNGYDS